MTQKPCMDGKGRWINTVFIERLWCSAKYEKVCLHAYEGLNQARDQSARCFDFYHNQRPLQALGCMPEQMYYDNLPKLEKAG